MLLGKFKLSFVNTIIFIVSDVSAVMFVSGLQLLILEIMVTFDLQPAPGSSTAPPIGLLKLSRAVVTSCFVGREGSSVRSSPSLSSVFLSPWVQAVPVLRLPNIDSRHHRPQSTPGRTWRLQPGQRAGSRADFKGGAGVGLVLVGVPMDFT